MKTGLALVAALAAVLAGAAAADPATEEKYKEMGTKCWNITRPDPEEMKRVAKKEKPQTEEGRLFYGCMFTEMGLISSHGGPNKQKCIEMAETAPELEKKKMTITVEEFCEVCCNKKYNTETEFKGGYEMLQCFESHAPEPILKDSP